MKISIITVCLDAKDTIEETFVSIISQTYKNFEYIIIDGASSDGTLEIIDKYKENISYLLSEPDKGVYEAMNKGLKKATGDFIFFLNANDTFYNEKVLEIVVRILSENPDKKLLFGDVSRIYRDKKNLEKETYEKVKDVFYFINSNICHQCIFYHKSLFKQFGQYSNEYQIFADWDFNTKCLVQNRVPSLYVPILISQFQMGGICTDREKYKEIYKHENELIIKKYYSNIAFLIHADRFFMKFFKTIYQIFIRNVLVKKIAELFVSQEKYKLDISDVKI